MGSINECGVQLDGNIGLNGQFSSIKECGVQLDWSIGLPWLKEWAHSIHQTPSAIIKAHTGWQVFLRLWVSQLLRVGNVAKQVVQEGIAD